VKRVRELSSQWALPPPAEQQLVALLGLLADSTGAATAVRDPERAVDLHVADSLSGLEALASRSRAEAIVDIGSGAGFPGLPLAIALPQVRLDLLEATGRKCRFLEHAIERLALANAATVCGRAEEWAAGAGRDAYDAATARAVGRLPELVEYASPLLREGGLLVAWKGRRDPVEERAGAEAAALVGLRPGEVLTVEPFPGARSRHLHTYEKVAPTPPRFPRRPGMARKRPLAT
jgi:16S rRNA (guanine527-N7)-methyltransferase